MRRGIYPALNMFLVFFVPLLITINYYDMLTGVVANISPESSTSVREMIAFIVAYLACFGACVFVCLRLCVDAMRIHKVADAVGGAAFGAACGIACSGVLMLMWFTIPFVQKEFPVDDGKVFFPATKLTLNAASFVAGRIPGGRTLIGERFLRDMRYGLPQIPSAGSGVYVSSIPTGQRVFIDASGMSFDSFRNSIKDRMVNPHKELTSAETKSQFFETRRTPVYVPTDAKNIKIAVVMDNIPYEVTHNENGQERAAADMFANDGETDYMYDTLRSDRKFFLKIYRMELTQGTTSSIISVFQPADKALAGKMIPSLLPGHICFPADSGQLRNALGGAGATPSDMDKLLLQLQCGGKALFQAGDGTPRFAEMLANKEWRICPVPVLDLKGLKRGSMRGNLYPPDDSTPASPQ